MDMVIHTMAAIHTPTATPLPRTAMAILTATDIVAHITELGITRAIGMQAITLIVVTIDMRTSRSCG